MAEHIVVFQYPWAQDEWSDALPPLHLFKHSVAYLENRQRKTTTRGRTLLPKEHVVEGVPPLPRLMFVELVVVPHSMKKSPFFRPQQPETSFSIQGTTGVEGRQG